MLSTDGYRIIGESETVQVEATQRPTPQPLPRAQVVRPRHRVLRRDEVVNWLVMLVFLVGMYWYAFSLPAPHH